MRKYLSLVFVFILVFSTLAITFHHHNDGADHPDCSICAAIHNQQSDSTSPAIPYEIHRSCTETVYSHPVLTIVTKTFLTPANNRAPPA